ncbi:MAG TPA: hypothetical protein PLL10_07925 [Elusimicrobiales bacterium]|nr:hypothetical protein [Elusimicrobiales bacterium]
MEGIKGADDAESFVRCGLARLEGVILLVASTALAAALIPARGTSGDTKIWLKWMSNFALFGLRTGYEANQDNYPPFSGVILYLSAMSGEQLGLSSLQSLKLCLLFFLLLSSLVFWLWTRNILATAALQIAMTLSSMGLSQLDVMFAPPLLAALWALQKRRVCWFAVFYSIACLIKWQPLLIAPFLALHLIRNKLLYNRPAAYLPPALVVGLAFFLGGHEIFRCFHLALQHPYLSGNALNLGWVLTYLLRVLAPQSWGGHENNAAAYLISYDWRVHIFPQALFLAAYFAVLVAFVRAERSFTNLVWYSLAGYLTYFFLNTGVHDNHLFIVVVLSAVLLALNRAYATSFCVWSFAANLNLFIFWGVDGGKPGISTSMGITVIFALLNLILFCGTFASAVFSVLFLKTAGRGAPGTADGSG